MRSTSQHTGAISKYHEPTAGVNSNSNLGGNPGFDQFQYFSAADTADCALPLVLEQLTRALFNYQKNYLQRQKSNVWSSHLKMTLKQLNSNNIFFILHISPEIFSQTTLWDSGIINLLEKLLNLFRIQELAPLGFSRQFDGQQDALDNIFCVEECWLCKFLLRVEATQRDLGPAWRYGFSSQYHKADTHTGYRPRPSKRLESQVFKKSL